MATKAVRDILTLINAGAAAGNGLQQILGRGKNLGSKENVEARGQKEYDTVHQSVLADVRKNGIRKTNLAYLTISSAPRILQDMAGVSGGPSTGIMLLVRNRTDVFTVPAVTFATSEIKRYGMGPIEKKPYLPIFSDLTIDVIADSAGDIHKFFYLWMNGIINFFDIPSENASYDNFGEIRVPGLVGSGKHPYTIEYKDNYTVDMEIRMFGDDQASRSDIKDIKIVKAFPVSIGEIQYNWNNINELVRFPVTFNFVHWKYNVEDPSFGFSVPKAEQSSSNFNFIYNLLIQLYPAAQALELATKRPQQVQDVLSIVNAGRTSLSPITRYF